MHIYIYIYIYVYIYIYIYIYNIICNECTIHTICRYIQPGPGLRKLLPNDCVLALSYALCASGPGISTNPARVD